MENLLFLAHRIPYPPNKGDKIRSYHLLKYLTSKYQVHLGAFIDDDKDWQYINKLDALCTTTHYQSLNPFQAKIKSLQGFLTGEALSLPYYKSKTLQEWINHTINTHSINKVLIFSSVMAQFITPFLQCGKEDNLDVIIDFVDVDSDKWRQYALKKRGAEKWVYQRESQYLFNYELKIAALAKAGLFVSEQEAALFRTLAPSLSEKIGYINNGVDTDYFSPEQTFTSPYPQGDEALVFTGAMDYWPNVDAVTWFSMEVFPHILNQYPNTKFYIVGSRPSKEVQTLAKNKNIVVTGAVEDVRPYIAHAKLAIAPLRIARGIQNKVLEAMAMGKHVLATPAAMEGIPYDESLALSVADEADAMVKQLNDFLQNNTPPLTSMINRDFVKMKFGWEQNLNRLSALI
ncbi:TIGR03087 family PEP-CTERM/XrtA system glycosyltransferase [Candidatus Methylomicrobium oryzae]|uniref:TIGR03087 family PEP-CTERM/XrtA system glycosyltransferase n=1 Tax=Candidatus Methylomicrobium oryzae TaxID=2802053 RepID=UPI001923C4C0|nr:TIGR03087 family PEP-CTERM/XrtA system glycosyltransferase [Methylomicrobium sp. RS1]MBL1264954.1 TIGR03087 family PEP-CTERM/XrtA system glycosyltransferase [Methylomicrobium sp. RS1]